MEHGAVGVKVGGVDAVGQSGLCRRFEAASLTAEEAAASEEAAELAGAPDAPQPVREPASTAPASRRANLWFSFMMIYLEVSILQKRL